MISPIWIVNFPLPPSVNEYLLPVAGGWKTSKTGRQYQAGRWVKSKLHTDYVKHCQLWKLQNKAAFENMAAELSHEIDLYKSRREKICFRVDTYFAFEYSRIWTKENTPQSLDSDNRLKPCRDALAKLLCIDDKMFFSGFFEKVTTSSKELECSILKISRGEPRTLDQILQQIRTEKRPATSSPA